MTIARQTDLRDLAAMRDVAVGVEDPVLAARIAYAIDGAIREIHHLRWLATLDPLCPACQDEMRVLRRANEWRWVCSCTSALLRAYLAPDDDEESEEPRAPIDPESVVIPW